MSRHALWLSMLLLIGSTCIAAVPAPNSSAIEIPDWFKPSFLDFGQDIAEATKHRKRLMVYFGQDGCPYCRELMRVNFRQKDIVDETRKNFDALAINIWGDREVVWLDRRHYTEKSFAAFLKIQFTPTILFFDEHGTVVLRLNGYYPPHKFAAALQYASGGTQTHSTFAEYLAQSAREPASATLHDEPFLRRAPYDFSGRRKGAKPLAVLFEQKGCGGCDELHRTGFKDPRVSGLLEKFDIVQLELFGQAPIVTPPARRATEAEWARQLNVAYTPSIVFFDRDGEEIFRVEGYLRPFHLAASFDYVASGSYRKEPSFQRYIQARAKRIREQGGRVELW
jgi:thioredoxin-related protein